MAIEFNMPKLGLTMEEGTIIEWIVAPGASVTAGTAVLTVETDKVQTDVEIPEGGRLHILGDAGSTYRCGERIGWILGEGEELPARSVTVATATATATATAKGEGGRLKASPFARHRARAMGVDIDRVAGTGPGGRIVSEDVEHAAAAAVPSSTAEATRTAAITEPAAQTAAAATISPPGAPRRSAGPPATFAAAELARLVGIDLSSTPILATSPDGRISRQDVADHVRSLLAGSGTSSRSAVPAPTFAPLMQEPATVLPLRGMRSTIASRMRSSLQDMAQLTLMMDVDMDAVVADRNSRKEAASVPGYTDYVIAAASRALRDHPRVNSQVTPDGIALLPRINVGLAVALDDGLVVPVVQDADRCPLDELCARTTRLAEDARAGRLKLADTEGGTFSVTALGSYGVDGFTPIINPPNAAILGVGRLRDEVAWSDDGSIRRVKRLTLSLTWDHRAFDGAPAAAFVRTISQFLDDPTTLG